MKKLLTFPLFLIVMVSCEKVIDVDLNTADPKTVIDASLCAQDSVHVVFISESGRFTDAQGLARISGAVVTITDQLGVGATFTEFDSSIYILQGYPLIDGNTYELKVNRGDEEIVATSTLYPQIPIDSVYFEEDLFGGGGPGSDETAYRTRLIFQDPAAVANYYRVELTVNDTIDRNFIAINDELTNGNEQNRPYFFRDVYEGDEVDVDLWTIDQAGFDYFRTMQDISSDGGFASATPYNPISNLSGGLGNFTVYNRSSYSAQVTP